MRKRDKILTLSDGRKLGYAEYGDPKGKPLFFFHGWPSSRLQAKITHTAAKKLHARIISLDRPGYGFSDFQEKRTLLHWPNDVVEAADLLQIKKFGIIGVSGGGPYAAVCAYKIPQRLTNVGIVAGLSPTRIKGVIQNLSFLNRLSWYAQHRFPFLVKLNLFVPMLFFTNVFPRLSAFFSLAEADRKILTKKVRKDMARNRAEAFKQGNKATGRDLQIYASDWGFDLKQITARMHLWYGGADRSVSLAMGKYYEAQVKFSTLVVYPNEGHFLIRRHINEIIKTSLVI